MIDFNPIVPPGHIRLDGFVKVKLAHGQGFSLLLVDRVYVENAGSWIFFEPANFGPPRLSFRDADAMAHVYIDTEDGETLFVDFSNSGFAGRLPDGSQLFTCLVSGPADFATRPAGQARRTTDGSFELQLFHHTAPATLPLIMTSGYVRGSPWNLQGNKRLANVGYAYLTSRPAISDDQDLAAVAMATDRRFGLLLDDHVPPDGVIVIEVTRSATTDRTATLALWVADHMVASAHLLRHDLRGMGIYYEAVLPAVFRVGIKPGSVLDFVGEVATPAPDTLQRFDYVIVGDARNPAGIVAPYDEEDTRAVCKVERVDRGDVVSFWRDNGNSDLFSGLIVDRQIFAGPA